MHTSCLPGSSLMNCNHGTMQADNVCMHPHIAKSMCQPMSLYLEIGCVGMISGQHQQSTQETLTIICCSVSKCCSVAA